MFVLKIFSTLAHFLKRKLMLNSSQKRKPLNFNRNITQVPKSHRMKRHFLNRIFEVCHYHSEQYYGNLSNISQNGAAIITLKPQPLHSEISLKVRCNDHSDDLHDFFFQAVCMWTKNSQSAGLFESGFKFSDAPFSTQRGISKLTEFFSCEVY